MSTSTPAPKKRYRVGLVGAHRPSLEVTADSPADAVRKVRYAVPEATATTSVTRIFGRCPEHPAYEPDYCPQCGTARQIGGTR